MRMHLTRPLTVAALVLGLAASSAAADPQPFKVDLQHSLVSFSVRHFFSKVQGRFNVFSGALQLDEKNLANSSADVTVQATSIFTNVEKRDNHLRSADFFDVEKFPTLTFKSTKVTPGENGSFQMAGDLTIHGVTKPVVFNGTLLGVGAIGMGGQNIGTRAGFEASTTVNRKDFGLLWNRALDQGGTLLGDDVTITLEVEAIKDVPAPAGAQAAPAKK